MHARPLRSAVVLLFVAVGLVPLASGPAVPRPGIDWPSFRGIGAAGVGDGKSTLTSWNLQTGAGVKWKTPISGLGHSSPIVWGHQVCVATATSEGGDENLRVGLSGDIKPVEDQTLRVWKAICADKRSGKVLWERDLHRGVPAINRHTKASHANCTPATDGKHVVAFFGSEGLLLLRHGGQAAVEEGPRPARRRAYYVVPKAQWGFGSSPVIHDGLVIVQCDVQKGSFLAAFDVDPATENGGRTATKCRRGARRQSSRPAAKKQVVVNGYKHIGRVFARTMARSFGTSRAAAISPCRPRLSLMA